MESELLYFIGSKSLRKPLNRRSSRQSRVSRSRRSQSPCPMIKTSRKVLGLWHEISVVEWLGRSVGLPLLKEKCLSCTFETQSLMQRIPVRRSFNVLSLDLGRLSLWDENGVELIHGWCLCTEYFTYGVRGTGGRRVSDFPSYTVSINGRSVQPPLLMVVP